MDAAFHFHTEELPIDRFVAEDFEDGPEPRMLDADRCTARGALLADWTQQTDADGAKLYCPFL